MEGRLSNDERLEKHGRVCMEESTQCVDANDGVWDELLHVMYFTIFFYVSKISLNQLE